MKKVLGFILGVIALFSICYANDTYKISKTYKFTNVNSFKGSYAVIRIGQKDFVKYGNDKSVTITPTPDSKFCDNYGNLYVSYDLGTYNSGRSLEINVERTYIPSFFSGDISSKASSTINDDNEIYTKPAEMIESDNDEIIAKSVEITKNIGSDYEKAKAIYAFVNGYMTYDTNKKYANQGAYAALINQRGNCVDYATLYAALCRVAGIPCRVVSGYLVKDKEAVITERHDWNEVWFDDYGWIPVDTCITYYYADGSKGLSYNNFCRIDGSEYVATELFCSDKIDFPDPNNSNNKISLKSIEVVYTNNLEYSSKEYFYIIEDAEEIVDDIKEEHKFMDIGDYTWAEDAINTLYDMGVIKGYNEYEFKPSESITRIEFVSMLARILRSLKYSAVSEGEIYYYEDYYLEHYSKEDYDFLMKCLEDACPGLGRYKVGEERITSIFGSELEMNKPITRGEVVALMEPFIKKDTPMTVLFTDISGHKFESGIIKAVRGELIKGYGDNTFRPDNSIKRAEVALILDRYIGVKTSDLFE